MKSTRSRRAAAAINPRDVTAVILARNEAHNLPLVFASLPPDMPVLVIDHQSTDATAHVAAQAGARVVTRPFEGFVNARRFALSQVQTPWTFMLDADERPDAALLQALRECGGAAAGYEISRNTFYRGKPLRMWRGERLLRIFKTDRADVYAVPAAGGEAQLHERWRVEGPVAHLDGVLLHDSYPSASAYEAKYNEYTQTEAGGLNYSPVALAAQTAKAPLRFAWYALARGAALDGADGLRVAWASARYPAVVQWKAKKNRS